MAKQLDLSEWEVSQTVSANSKDPDVVGGQIQAYGYVDMGTFRYFVTPSMIATMKTGIVPEYRWVPIERSGKGVIEKYLRRGYKFFLSAAEVKALRDDGIDLKEKDYEPEEPSIIGDDLYVNNPMDMLGIPRMYWNGRMMRIAKPDHDYKWRDHVPKTHYEFELFDGSNIWCDEDGKTQDEPKKVVVEELDDEEEAVDDGEEEAVDLGEAAVDLGEEVEDF